MIIPCDGCDYEFDPMDDRGWISNREAHALCPLCATILFRGSEAWAVWNDCNGVFETMWRRSEAEQAIKERYQGCDARAVPVRVIEEPLDVALRHWRETEYEDSAA